MTDLFARVHPEAMAEAPPPMPTIGRILGELWTLHDRKNADYAKTAHGYENLAAAQEWGIEPWVYTMMRAGEKVTRLQQYARTGTLRNEGVEDSLKDIAVLAVIALRLWRESRGMG